jgi:Zn-dependent peptidase ImmA (M78 family)/transcriptional regulator with XRE-family HTH domain
MTSVAITPEVFQWARQRAGLSDERLAKSVNIKPEKIRAWEKGEAFPNFRQTQKLAAALSVPLGYLFLSEPPEITLPIADFRTLLGKQNGKISLNLQEVLDDALRKRDWYAEWRRGEGFPALEFIGKFSTASEPNNIIQDMRQVLDIPVDFAASITTWEDHLRKFIQHVEAAGILVLQSGVVGNNTHRKLSTDEFRGFALSNDFSPLIFLNSVDFTVARIFTLAHELVHLWTGTSGISNPEIVSKEGELQDLELFCNRIAAEFLVHGPAFLRRWDKYQDAISNAESLSQYFRVSEQVILRRSYELQIITRDEFFQAYEEILKATKPRKPGKGGAFYNNLISRNSRRFTTELLSAVSGGHITYLDAARLLNTQPGNVVEAMKKFA